MNPRFQLQQMQQAAARALEYTTHLEFADFVRDPRTQDAVLLNLERLGLSATQLSAEFRDQHPEIKWPQMAVLAQLPRLHFGLQEEIIWDLLQTKLPLWLGQISALEGLGAEG